MTLNRIALGGIWPAVVFVGIVLFWRARPPLTVRAQSGCLNTPAVTINSPQTPADVCIPDGFGGNPIQYFDDYSWRAFISMVWPAATGHRGVPDIGKQVSASSAPLVFETLKSDWEVFQPMGDTPGGANNPPDPPSVSWNKFEGANPCGSTVGFSDMVLSSFSKFGDLGEAGNKPKTPFVHALPSQNTKWVRYLTAFNLTEYTQIVNGKLYLQSSLQKPVTFQTGALDVKSSWMDMTGIPDAQKSRYYTRSALVTDPTAKAGSGCNQITVGLVGLHIVQKTKTRPQWIWSTFEQVDNVPPTPGATGTFGFNDGKGGASPLQSTPPSDPNGGFPPNNWASPIVYNVVRLQPINSTGNNSFDTSTQATNTKYQQALSGTVWRFYELVMTQWPLQENPPNPIPPSQDGKPKNTFPGLNANSAFSNTTLETWDQASVFTGGCMACHTLTQKQTDFLWSLEINAFGNPGTGLMSLTAAKILRAPRSPAERQLMNLLRSTTTQTGLK